MPDGERVYSNCSWADLVGVNLGKEDLSGLDLSKADLSQANLIRANLIATKLDGAILCHTTMPNGKENNSGCEKN